MSVDLTALQARLRAFAAQRQWQPFHTPKNLAMALMVEAAELAEIFQWMMPEQSLAVREDPALENGLKYVLLSHNTKMGAAKGAILTGEWLASKGYIG